MQEYKSEDLKKKLKKAVNKNSYQKRIFTLDTETTSINNGENEKYGFCYIWMLGVDTTVFYSRNLESLKEALDIISEYGRAVCWVQNLGFDFQFLRNVISFTNVFAREIREVLKCKYKNIEFRDSYALSGMSLDEMAEKYNLPVKKLKGYDYDKIRTDETPLTEKKELEYCEHDCLVIYHYIKRMLNIYGNYKNLPLTFTGEVRKKLRNYIKYNYTGHSPEYAVQNWKEFVSKMTPTPDQFRDLIRCFAGGYVHCNYLYSCRTIENVHSADYTSSYIYVMLSNKMPMGQFFNYYDDIDLDNLDSDNYAYIFNVSLKNVELKGFMPLISLSKIDIHKSHGFIFDNGKLLSANEIVMTCNEDDLSIIRRAYDIEEIEILNVRRCRKKYLPKVFIEFVISLYNKKQELKPFKEEKSMEYNRAKSAVNSLYGLCIENRITNHIDYEDEWKKEKITDEEIDKRLNEMFKNKELLLPYCWGVWISSGARKNIVNCLIDFEELKNSDELEFPSRVIYSDTDCLKYLGNCDEIIEKYNKECRQKIKAMCEDVGIEYKGLEGIGEFDKEPDALKFRSCGSKKYCVEREDGLHLTLSGVSKSKGVKALKSIEDFKPGFIFEEEFTGKKAKMYNDEQPELIVTDYLGNTKKINQKYGVCLYPVSYKLDITPEYDNIIKNYSTASVLKKL